MNQVTPASLRYPLSVFSKKLYSQSPRTSPQTLWNVVIHEATGLREASFKFLIFFMIRSTTQRNKELETQSKAPTYFSPVIEFGVTRERKKSHLLLLAYAATTVPRAAARHRLTSNPGVLNFFVVSKKSTCGTG